MNSRLLKVLEGLVEMRERNAVSATLMSTDDEAEIGSCVSRINKILAEFHFLLGVDIHVIVRGIENRQLENFDEAQRESELWYFSLLLAVLNAAAGIRKELARLLPSSDAEYGKGRQTGKRTGCLPGTRVEVRDRLRKWHIDANVSFMFWLNGMAGTGKSTIADTFTTELEAAGFLVASFFCSRDYESARDFLRIFPSLAFQLAYKLPEYAAALADVLRRIPHPENLTLEQQLTQLILSPLKSITRGSSPFISLITDAIDECKDSRTHALSFVTLLLSHETEFRDAGVKVFISSRPAHEISVGFHGDESFDHHDHIILHEMQRQDVRGDIRTFIEFKFTEIRRRYPQFTFSQDDIDFIADAAFPLFIFASTVCAFIGGTDTDARRNPQRQLERLRSAFTSDASSAGEENSATKGLDILYQRIFISAFMAVDGVNYDDAEQAEQALVVVASILLLSQPLGLHDMAILLGEPYRSATEIRTLLMDLFSVITEPTDDVHPIRILHASFQDHLTSVARAHPKFFIDRALYHGLIATRCLQLMTDIMDRDNLLDLRPGVEYADLDVQELRMKHIPLALEYACQFWSYHLVRSSKEPTQAVIHALCAFVRDRLLRWIEVLVATKNLPRAVPAVAETLEWCSVSSSDYNVTVY